MYTTLTLNSYMLMTLWRGGRQKRSRIGTHITIYRILLAKLTIDSKELWREELFIYLLNNVNICRIIPLQIFTYKIFNAMVGRVPAFQHGGPGSLPGGVRNFNFCPGIGCVSFVCVLSCVVSGAGPDIVLTTHSGRPAVVYLSSVLAQRLLLLPQASDPRAFGRKSREGGSVNPRFGEGK